MAIPGWEDPLPFEVFLVNRLICKMVANLTKVWESSRSFRKSQSFVLGMCCYPGDTNTFDSSSQGWKDSLKENLKES